jgi:hypothetical protein
VSVAFPLCPEGGFDFAIFLAEPAMVRQGHARAVLAFFQNWSCDVAHLAVNNCENSLNHSHTALDARGAPFDAPPHVREWRLSPTYLTAQNKVPYMEPYVVIKSNIWDVKLVVGVTR